MVSKDELKALICEDLNDSFFEAEQLAANDAASWQGAKKSLNGAAKLVKDLLNHLEDEDFTDEQIEAVTRYINRAAEVCNSLRLKAEVHEQRALGRIEAFRISSKMITQAAKKGAKNRNGPDA
ncbi:hypothetical protein OAF54_03160 [bacterium]|nr:hypothetical protein [bacterium]